MKKRPFPRISDNHKRGITATLVLLDESLCQFERWAKGGEARSVLYEERNTLSAREREMLLAEIAEMQAILRNVRDTLRLEGSIQTARHAIRSQCFGLLEHLVEIESKYLGRYGEPPPGLGEYLDPKVAALEQRLDRIIAIARGKPLKENQSGERTG